MASIRTIRKCTEKQYKSKKENGEIDENALYLVDDNSIPVYLEGFDVSEILPPYILVGIDRDFNITGAKLVTDRGETDGD